jgi:hypothetical protein
MNRKFTTDEVAAILLLNEPELRRLAALHRLPPRHFVQRNAEANDEPDADERAAQERRKAECRAMHLQQRMAEPVTTTQSKVSKWRREICEPSAGRHMA